MAWIFVCYLSGRKYSEAIDFVSGQEIVGFFAVTVTIVHVRIGNNDFFRALRPSIAITTLRTNSLLISLEFFSDSTRTVSSFEGRQQRRW